MAGKWRTDKALSLRSSSSRSGQIRHRISHVTTLAANGFRRAWISASNTGAKRPTARHRSLDLSIMVSVELMMPPCNQLIALSQPDFDSPKP